MHISEINIFQFRNLSNFSLKFHPKLSIICGKNGSGKTSILEAIYFLSMGRSFRSSQLTRIIKYEKNSFQIFAKFFSHKNRTCATVRHKNDKNILKIDGKKVFSQEKLTSIFPVQFFSPESINLINNGSQKRCKILDWGVYYYHNKYNFLNLLQQSKRLVKQRNAALKKHYPLEYIEILDKELIDKSEKIDLARSEYYAVFFPKLIEILYEFLPTLAFKITYYCGWPQNKTLAEVLKSSYFSDAKIGFTKYGIHRADLQFYVNGHPVHSVLSRGQLKILILAIKLAQGEFLSKKQKDKENHCIYLIDDIFSELDPENLRKILNKLISLNNAQVIITTIKLEYLKDLLGNQVEFDSFDLN